MATLSRNSVPLLKTRTTQAVSVLSATLTWITLFAGHSSLAADEWPMWRFDAYRSAASPESLPENLQLAWVRQYEPRRQVWDDPLNHDVMPYDKVFEPIILEDRMFFGFNDRDKVVALDLDSGRKLWEFYTDGPVRLPPAGADGRLFFTSDDGYLYCVSVETGELLWRFRGGPSERKVIGNGRIISAWPARGGPGAFWAYRGKNKITVFW